MTKKNDKSNVLQLVSDQPKHDNYVTIPLDKPFRLVVDENNIAKVTIGKTEIQFSLYSKVKLQISDSAYN